MIAEVLLRASECVDFISVLDKHSEQKDFLHIVSCNPENIMIATGNREFYDLYFSDTSFVISDGVGVKIGSAILGISNAVRRTGVDTFQEIVTHVKTKRIVLVGGSPKTASKVAQVLNNNRTNQNTIIAIDNTSKDDSQLIHHVTKEIPDIVFVAFGSPHQELWIERNKSQLTGVICMGVGGTFDFVSGNIPRAPKLVRNVGLEWLFRLIVQPWRFTRQIRLIQYLSRVLVERFE